MPHAGACSIYCPRLLPLYGVQLLGALASYCTSVIPHMTLCCLSVNMCIAFFYAHSHEAHCRSIRVSLLVVPFCTAVLLTVPVCTAVLLTVPFCTAVPRDPAATVELRNLLSGGPVRPSTLSSVTSVDATSARQRLFPSASAVPWPSTSQAVIIVVVSSAPSGGAGPPTSQHCAMPAAYTTGKPRGCLSARPTWCRR